MNRKTFVTNWVGIMANKVVNDVKKMSYEERIKVLFDLLDERQRRLIAGTEAEMLGRGGVVSIAKLTGLSPSTVARGVKELRNGIKIEPGGRVRAKGGGRKGKKDQYPQLASDIRKLWNKTVDKGISFKSFGDLVREEGYDVGDATIGSILKELKVRPRKRIGAKKKPAMSREDIKERRNYQQNVFTQKARDFLARGLPVITLSTKVEVVGAQQKRVPKKNSPVAGACSLEEVLTAVSGPSVARLIPRDGSCNLSFHRGWTNLDIYGDAGAFAINALRYWWQSFGASVYEDAKEILICIQDRGENVDLFNYELQKWCNAVGGLTIHVCQVPQGLNQWNKLEHRFISLAPGAHEVQDEKLTVVTMVNELSLNVKLSECEVSAYLDTEDYKKPQRKVSQKAISNVKIQRDGVYGHWNYSLPSL